MVELLLTQGADVNGPDSTQDIALDYAAEAGNEACVQLLLEKGLRAHAKHLRDAAINGHLGMLQLLLAHGLDVNGTEWPKKSPLRNAVANGHESCVRILLDNGARIDYMFDLGLAIMHGHFNIANLLLYHEASIPLSSLSPAPSELGGRIGHTSHPCVEAPRANQSCLLKSIIERGFDIASCDYSGRTPLRFAANLDECRKYSSTSVQRR